MAGWGRSSRPIGVRDLAARHGRYVETFLAATIPWAGQGDRDRPDRGRCAPTAERDWSIDALVPNLPAHSIVLAESELPRAFARGRRRLMREVMAMWERFAAPFLAAAEQSKDPIAKAVGFRQTIRRGLRLRTGHQHLSDLAKRWIASCDKSG